MLQAIYKEIHTRPTNQADMSQEKHVDEFYNSAYGDYVECQHRQGVAMESMNNAMMDMQSYQMSVCNMLNNYDQRVFEVERYRAMEKDIDRKDSCRPG